MVLHSLISTIGILTASFAGIVSSPKNVADTTSSSTYSTPLGYVLNTDNLITWFKANYSTIPNPDEDDDNVPLMDFGNGECFHITGNDHSDYDLTYFMFGNEGGIYRSFVNITYGLSVGEAIGVSVADNGYHGGYVFITDVIPTYYYNFGDYDVFLPSSIPGSEIYEGQWLSSVFISPNCFDFFSLHSPSLDDYFLTLTSALYSDARPYSFGFFVSNSHITFRWPVNNSYVFGEWSVLFDYSKSDFLNDYPYGCVFNLPVPCKVSNANYSPFYDLNRYPYITNPSNSYYDSLSARYFCVNGLYNTFICDDNSFYMTSSDIHSMFGKFFPLNNSISNLGGIYKLLTFNDDDTYLYIDCGNFVNSDHSLVVSKDFYLKFMLNGVKYPIYHSEYLLTSSSWHNDINFIDGSYDSTSWAFSLSVSNAFKVLTCDSSVINIMATNGAYSCDVDDIYNKGYSEGYNFGYSVGNESGTAVSNVFDLLSKAFTSIGGFLSFEVLPNISVGLLLFIPVVVSLIIFVIKLIAGGGK